MEDFNKSWHGTLETHKQQPGYAEDYKKNEVKLTSPNPKPKEGAAKLIKTLHARSPAPKSSYSP